MKRNISGAALLFGVVLISSVAIADDPVPLSAKMQRAYGAYKALQPYLWSNKGLSDPKQSAKVLKLVTELKENFHQIPEGDPTLISAPGFKAYLSVLDEALGDSIYALREGDPQWALWRLRTISNHCQTCHTTYKPGLRFEDPSVDLAKLSNLEKAEFYLATRSFDKAEAAFLDAANNPEPGHHSLTALRKWLVIYTRVNPNPTGAREKLEEILAKPTPLYPYESDEIKEWTLALKAWEGERLKALKPLEHARLLMTKTLRNSDPLSVDADQVSMLRASALLHRALESEKLSDKERAEALYLLGLAYSKLPLFFINELPEIYFELSIREFPNTSYARNAFALYRDVVLSGFTGSGGTHLPGEVRLKIQELHDLAFGVKPFQPRI